jgi:hypothetical protein
MSTLNIYLARYPTSSLFNDHWALFVPDSATSPSIGTIFQVEGDPLKGFTHDVQRQCDVSKDHLDRHPVELIDLDCVTLKQQLRPSTDTTSSG